MAPLDYQSPRPAKPPVAASIVARIVFLAIVPLLTLTLSYFVLDYTGQEPFAHFRIFDAAILVGGPVLVACLWVVWTIAALRRRSPWVILLLSPVYAWGAINIWALLHLGMFWYFREPWNQ